MDLEDWGADKFMLVNGIAGLNATALCGYCREPGLLHEQEYLQKRH